MPDEAPEDFTPVALAYSAPPWGKPLLIPTVFYNAFPDLNDVAPDGSRSAFPRRAKYTLPLDSEFLPSAMWVDCNNIGKFGKASLRLPREPELNEKYRFESLFEISHKRLAATDAKWVFRAHHLAPFYTTLEDHLVRGRKIDVPLVPDESPRASRLQRHWKNVLDIFQRTLFLDESVSLLICLTLLPLEEAKAHEQAWVEHEAAEIRGFADYYQKLRDEFNPESATTETDRRALAERILQHAKEVFSSGPRGKKSFDSLAEEVSFNVKVSLEEKNQRIVWPRLLGEEVHRGLRQLRVQDGLVLGRVAARMSIPEVMQWLMALLSVLDDKERSFTRKDDAWPEYVGFSLEIGEGIACPRITSANTSHLQMLVHLGINLSLDYLNFDK
jgi:hypothetical protein